MSISTAPSRGGAVIGPNLAAKACEEHDACISLTACTAVQWDH